MDAQGYPFLILFYILRKSKSKDIKENLKIKNDLIKINWKDKNNQSSLKRKTNLRTKDSYIY